MKIAPETFVDLFNSFPHVNDGFPYLAAKPLNEAIVEESRSVFLRHEAAQSYGLSIIHRTFELGPRETLLEYGNVSTPWQIPSIVPVLKGRVVPRNWTFANGVLQPYEYQFLSAEQDEYEGKFEMSREVVEDLYDVLARHALENMYGQALLLEDAHNVAIPPKLECTAGRSNITSQDKSKKL